MFPVGFLLHFDTKVLRYESVFIIIIKIVLNSLVICHLWYRFSIDTEVLHSGIVPKPELWYQAIPSCESEAPDCPCDVGIAPLYSVHSHS